MYEVRERCRLCPLQRTCGNFCLNIEIRDDYLSTSVFACMIPKEGKGITSLVPLEGSLLSLISELGQAKILQHTTEVIDEREGHFFKVPHQPVYFCTATREYIT
ncbi:hypothetical protein Pelo_8521 [Pelomyxa schiedti]|nr:hypothetical protein Pelo_8521 [Pelomyxa schiedti]